MTLNGICCAYQATKSNKRLAQSLFDLADDSYRYGSPWSVKIFAADLNQTNQRYLLLFVNNQLSGFIGYTSVLDQAEITNFVITKKFQHQGIGQQFFLSLLDQLLVSNVHSLLLEVRKQNAPATRFYLKQGFMLTGERKNYYQQPADDAWLMTKELNNG